MISKVILTTISEIVPKLKQAVEQMNLSTGNVRNLILELARILNESGKVKTDEISVAIKKYLQTEIKQGKITAKWIEECLPKEYKRKYVKSEGNSLSSPNESVITSDGSCLIQDFKEENQQTSQGEKDLDNGDPAREIVEPRGFLKGTKLQSSKIHDEEFKVPKKKLEQIVEALNLSTSVCYIMFDANGLLTSIEADVLREKQK